mmetsp:Transcript_6296/g.19727  ORF Transcript_6296/g.19727 Transcript_6296/m.19727 type:complete len:371 (+) Transcript_6296:1062-2174(+)
MARHRDWSNPWLEQPLSAGALSMQLGTSHAPSSQPWSASSAGCFAGNPSTAFGVCRLAVQISRLYSVARPAESNPPAKAEPAPIARVWATVLAAPSPRVDTRKRCDGGPARLAAVRAQACGSTNACRRRSHLATRPSSEGGRRSHMTKHSGATAHEVGVGGLGLGAPLCTGDGTAGLGAAGLGDAGSLTTSSRSCGGAAAAALAGVRLRAAVPGANSGLSETITTDMLSREPLSRHLSSSASQTAPRSQAARCLPPPCSCSVPEAPRCSGAGRSVARSSPATKLTHSCDDITSQMPSHARMTNSSSGWRASLINSGAAVTACTSAGRSSRCLYAKSPSARDTARSPFTRLNLTCPPARSMRVFSSSRNGL